MKEKVQILLELMQENRTKTIYQLLDGVAPIYEKRHKVGVFEVECYYVGRKTN